MALEWIAAAVGSPGGPAVLVWYEPATDLVVDIRITDASFRDAPALFAHATQEPKVGEPRRPTRVRVADEALAAVLREIPDLEVVVGDISDAREMLAALGAHISQLELVPDVAPHVWERFFRAAAALYRARPWQTVPSDAWLEVDCAPLGGAQAFAIAGGALTVVGQHGTSHGILLCHSAEDAAAWLAAGERRERGEPATFPHEFFMLGYDDHRDVDPDDLAEISRRGWEVAAFAAYPVLSVLDEGAVSRLPTNAEVIGVAAIIEALAAFVADEPDLADAWDGEPVEWQTDLDGARVRFAAPLAVHEPDDDTVMERLAEVLVEFADVYHSAAFATITAEQLEALLLDTIPAQLAVEPAEAPMILAATRALLAASPLAAGLDDAFEARLARELADERNFTPGKQLVMAGIAAGFDMSSEEGVEEFVQAFAREHVAQSAPKARSKAKAKPASKAKGNAASKAKAKPASKAKAKPASKAKAKSASKAPAKPKANPRAKTKAKPKRR